MAEKPRVRTLIDSQHVERYKTLLKSSRQQFCHLFLLFWKNFSSKSSVLVVSEIMRLFVNILTPDNKYSLAVKLSV